MQIWVAVDSSVLSTSGYFKAVERNRGLLLTQNNK